MNDRQHKKPSSADLKKPGAAETASPGSSRSEVAPATDSKCGKELSADEQMALYEKELKENDWGHQPC
jgi:hypothetical protein